MDAKLGIVRRLLLVLGKVSSVPQGLHHVSLLSHDLLSITDCSAVTVCDDVADDGGLWIAEETSVDFLHSSGVLHSYLPYFFYCTACFLCYSQ